MTIVGMNLTKIEATRNKGATRQVKIKNDVKIIDVKEMDMKLGTTNQKGLNISFKYQSVYDPNQAKIIIEGDILDLGKEEEVKKIVETWKKSKKLDEKVAFPVLNYILAKTNIEAIFLADRLNLPSPVPMPKLNKKKK